MIAKPVAAGTLLSTNLNGTLLRVHGLITSSRINGSNLEMILGRGEYNVAVSVPLPGRSQENWPTQGDTVEVQGVLDVQTDAQVFTYRLLLQARSISDVRIVARRPWLERTNWGSVAPALLFLASILVAISIFWWRRAVNRARQAVQLAGANSVLTRCLREMATESDPRRATDIVLQEIALQADAEACYWFDYDEDSETLQQSVNVRSDSTALCGDTSQVRFARKSFSASSPVIQQLLARPCELAVTEVHDGESGKLLDVIEGVTKHGSAASLCFAVHLGDKPLGIVVMLLSGKSTLHGAQKELLRTLAHHLALSVHLTRLFNRANLAVALEERNRIARDIHDSLTQCFTGILMQLQAAAKYAERDHAVTFACLNRAQNMAREGLQEARRSVANLLGSRHSRCDLTQQIRALVEQATADTGVSGRVEVHGPVKAMDQMTAQNLIRICQEALSNAQRYAKAQLIAVTLTFEDGRLTLTIEDDGSGFRPEDADGSGFGLAGMRARAARLNADFSLQSQPGKGTKIIIALSFAPAVIATGELLQVNHAQHIQ